MTNASERTQLHLHVGPACYVGKAEAAGNAIAIAMRLHKML